MNDARRRREVIREKARKSQTPTLTIETLRTMKAQLMGAAVIPRVDGSVTAWYRQCDLPPVSTIEQARITKTRVQSYLQDQRTGLKNEFEGD